MSIEPFPAAPTQALSTASADDSANLAFLNADQRGDAAGGKPSFTVSEAAMRLTHGEPGWSGALGVAAVISYGFRASAPNTLPEDASGFSRFNAAQIHQAEQAMTAWSDVANIKFVRAGAGETGEAAYSDNASILFSNYASGQDGAAAFTYLPGQTAASSPSGDVWVNASLGYNANPSSGNYGGMTLVHEIGHAIGLDHPSDYDSVGGGTFTYAADASYYEDSRQFTVMSYFSESNTGGNFAGAYAASPLLDDIAAAQVEYGANISTRTGDTVYGFNATADRSWFEATSSATKLVFAVWDAGGADTLDFSGYARNQVIDLHQGAFSNVGGLVGNIAVAIGADIENARGGSGADAVDGNDLANWLRGEAGADTLKGAAGDDVIDGNDGNDRVEGGAGFDVINGNMGNDNVSGGDGVDWVSGGKDNDVLYGDVGADLVFGNMGADTAFGGDGDDWVRGGQDNDTIDGGAGNDWMSGDKGSDTVTGGTGADVFHISPGAGLDRVTDFHVWEGDRVQLDLGSGYQVYQSGADTVIDLGGGDQMLLVGVNASSLGDGWLFAA